jgi:aspartyl-tRNA(Asn)/glutamyl-tRNA(Gln) amidotransferase subunit C
MSLDAREVHRVAALARLSLEPDEERLFAEQLGRVVDYVDQIAAVAGEAEEESAVEGREAADLPRPCLDRELFLANAPASSGPFLVVPRVIGSGDA